MIMLAVPPPGISPCPSAIVHRPPSERTVSDPLNLEAGWSGPMTASDSYLHWPTSFCNQWCSFCGSACIARLLFGKSQSLTAKDAKKDIRFHFLFLATLALLAVS